MAVPCEQIGFGGEGERKKKKKYRVRLNSSRVKKADALQKHQVFS